MFSYPSVLTYVLGAQKNRLIETVLLSTQNICFGLEIRKLNFSYALLIKVSKSAKIRNPVVNPVIMSKPAFAVREQQRHRSACGPVLCDQHKCNSKCSKISTLFSFCSQI